MLCISSAADQSVNPPNAGVPWGGYPVADTVPYQPTIEPQPQLGESVWTEPPEQVFTGPALPYPPCDPNLMPGEMPCVPIADPYAVESETGPNGKSLLPPGTRDGVFQKVNVYGTWLPRLESDSFGYSNIKTNVVLGLPLFTRETPLVITPQYQIYWTDGPDFIDVPPRLHDAQTEFRHFRRVGENWIAEGAIQLGVYADDYSFDADDAFRVNGRALAIYEPSPEWKWILGVAYINAAGYTVLPVAGVAYSTDDFKAELVFPRSKIGWRLLSSPAPGLDERWIYVTAELTGGQWAVQRESGINDVLSYSDWRIAIGYERKIIGGLSRTFEVGYVFNRELLYDTVPGDIEIDDTLMVRMGVTY